MFRLLLLDMVPFVGFLALIEATWLYDRENFLPAGLIYALLFFVYLKLQRIEMSLSADIRETLLLKTDNRVAYGFAKILAAAVVCGAIYVNSERGWVDVRQGMEKLGLSRTAAAGGTAVAPEPEDAKEATGRSGKERIDVTEGAEMSGEALSRPEEAPVPLKEESPGGTPQEVPTEKITGKEDGGWEAAEEENLTREKGLESEGRPPASEEPVSRDEEKTPPSPTTGGQKKPRAPVISGFQTEAD
ncbi:MAG: hypothetical protein HY720_30780 [Planctomycetes bacterium]|nr:hypothetical protein [Planctomycetota bacterium]